MRITLFALLALGISTAPAFAGARIHRLYHAPIQPQRALLQKPQRTAFSREGVVALPGKTIPMLPTSRPLPPPQSPAATAEPDIPVEPTVSDVGPARTLPIIPVTARTPEASPSAQPVLNHPRARYSGRVVAPAAPSVVPLAAQLTTGTVQPPPPVPSPAPAPKPLTQKAQKATPQRVVVPTATPTPAAAPAAAPAVTPAPSVVPEPKPHRRLPIAPVS